MINIEIFGEILMDVQKISNNAVQQIIDTLTLRLLE